MNKLVVALFTFAFSNISYAESVFLSCNVSGETQVSNGYATKLTPENITIEISEMNNSPYISMTGSENYEFAVANLSMPGYRKYTNLSNENQYKIIQEDTLVKTHKIKSVAVDFKLNRVTGSINVYSQTSFRSGIIVYRSFSGTCQKAQGRKF